MEGISRLVSESLARHGFDRPLDYRRLHWSRWFRCESLHSLLFVPSKPGVFALAEEIMDLASGNAHVGTAALGCPAGQSSAAAEPERRRMLAVAQFFESDDMAFSLDRMLVQTNPMRARLNSGRYFIRYVTIGDESQRRSIATALNQWLSDSGEKISGIGAHFASSLELTETRASSSSSYAHAEHSPATPNISSPLPAANAHLDSGSASNIHCPSPLPSGF